VATNSEISIINCSNSLSFRRDRMAGRTNTWHSFIDSYCKHSTYSRGST